MPIKPVFRLCALLILSATMVSCSDGGNMIHEKTKLLDIKNIPDSTWQKLREKKIFFGHQSVGNNIIEGLKRLGRENPALKLDIMKVKSVALLDRPGLYHCAIGKNEDPVSKINSFVKAMNQGIGKTVDIAFFKFCFVDIDANTDISKLFNYYVEAMEQLHARYPHVAFVHFTVPLLKRNKPSFKLYIKKFLGKGGGFFDDAHNIARNKFNRMMREKYRGKEPLFDLALFESTFPDGRRCTFVEAGKTYYSLVPEYTNDGGHLNSLGEKMIAEQLLIFLGTISRNSSS